MRYRKCEQHFDCTLTLLGGGKVEHSRTHDKPMPLGDVELADPAIYSALADLLAAVENLGKRVKALEPQVQRTSERFAAEKVLTDARLSTHMDFSSRLGEKQSTLTHANEALSAELDAAIQKVRELDHRRQETEAHIAVLRAEVKRLRGDTEATANEAAKAMQHAMQADQQFAQFAALDARMKSLEHKTEHERAERVAASRKFQRSMRDVSHTIAE